MRFARSRQERVDGGELIITDKRIVLGTTDALMRMPVTWEPGSFVPLDSFASHVLDPKRVGAELAGVGVLPARFPPPPRIEVVMSTDRIEDGASLRVQPGAGIARIDATIDGELHAAAGRALTERAVELATRSGEPIELPRILDTLPIHATSGRLEVRVVAVDGLTSEIAAVDLPRERR